MTSWIKIIQRHQCFKLLGIHLNCRMSRKNWNNSAEPNTTQISKYKHNRVTIAYFLIFTKMCRYNTTLNFIFNGSTLPHEPNLKGIWREMVRSKDMELNLFVVFQPKEHWYQFSLSDASPFSITYGYTALCGLVVAGLSASAGLVPSLRTTEDPWSHLGVGALWCYLLVKPVPLVLASGCKSSYAVASLFFLEASPGSLNLSEHSQAHSGMRGTSGFLTCA